MSELCLPEVEGPLVSVVIPVFGQWELVRRAVESVIRNTEPCYELIAVDDASPDDTADRLAGIGRIRLLRNDRNLGFGKTANRGAREASGEFLCLLNSDAFVQEGWLPPLLEVLRSRPGVGAVTPCFLGIDGRVFEAGSAVASDGTTVALGRDADPADPAYRFPRSIDYASAACMLLRRNDFLDLGGFDPVFGLGYCDDVDLCFRLAERGLRTIYEPRSRVVHVGNASIGRKVAERRARANTPLLRERWPAKLSRRPPLRDLDAYPHRLLAARDAGTAERILVIAERVPAPEERTGSLLLALGALLPDARITLLAESAGSEDGVRALLRAGIEVAREPADPREWLHSRLYHYSVVLVCPPATAGRLEEDLARTQPQALCLYDMAPGPASLAGATSASPARAWEVRALRAAGAVLYSAEADRRLAREVAPGVPAFPVGDPPDPREVANALEGVGLAPSG